jgi:hypothetical protein
VVFSTAAYSSQGIKMGGVDEVELTIVINRLLDRAATNPRLTPRLLREKAEQKMKLEPGELKAMKAKIMKMIELWWHSTYPEESPSAETADDVELSRLKSLNRFAKAVGKGPIFFKDLSDSNKRRADQIRKK